MTTKQKKQYNMPAILVTLLLVLLSFMSCNLNTNDKEKEILTALQANCNCEQVVGDMSSVGLTFHKDETMDVGNTYSFYLKGCESKDIIKETEELQSILSKEVEDFNKIARIELNYEFVNETKTQVILKANEILFR